MANRKKSTGNLIECKCNRCGATLSPENAREDRESISGFAPYCISCEAKYFDKLAQVLGRGISLYLVCAAYGVPCIPAVMDNETFEATDNAWIYYITQLIEKDEYYSRGKPKTFFNGVVNPLRLFGKDLTERDLARYIKVELDKISKQIGSAEQREKFGTIPIVKGLPFTQELYDELSRLLEIRESAYKGQDLTPQQQETLVKVAKADAAYNYLMSIGNIQQATNVQKAISQILSDEQMRPKDAKPVESFKVDSQVVALENAGLMENGKILPIDKLQTVLIDNFVKKKKYAQTIDIVDECMERIYNTMRQNAGLMIEINLPEELEVEDTWGEMAQEKSAEEQQTEREVGVTKVTFDKKNDGKA